ncbi:hypothetical protein M569_10694 [Genlisea aurea]|uniref:Uncharacterized protein n=1 Tax=Genlisea aurea TaxID=192259 RepID=S8DM75_9LAMI|nr:hypothetical protein M569_10694 [Genlisea aurea]
MEISFIVFIIVAALIAAIVIWSIIYRLANGSGGKTNRLPEFILLRTLEEEEAAAEEDVEVGVAAAEDVEAAEEEDVEVRVAAAEAAAEGVAGVEE